MTEMTSSSGLRPRLRVILAASVGSALAWYDFFLYGTAAALVLGDIFFPKSDPAIGTLLSFLTFDNTSDGALHAGAAMPLRA